MQKRKHVRATTLIALVFVALITIPGVALADPIYFATTLDGGDQSNSTGATSSGLVSGPLSPSGSGFTRQEFAAANSGGLRASARTTLNVSRPAGLGTYDFSGSGLARLRFDDFVITGPGTGTIPASANLMLNGAFGTNIFNFTNLFSAVLTSSIDVSISGNVAGNDFDGSFHQVHSLFSGLHAPGPCNPCETISSSHTGILGPGALPISITTPIFNLPVDTPFSFDLELSVAALARSQVDGSTCSGPPGPDVTRCSSSFLIDSLSDFSNTLSFPTLGPVFNLPNGFTLDSRQANIANNQLSQAVPEPSTALLLVCGLLALVGVGKPVLGRRASVRRRGRRRWKTGN